MAHDVEVNMKVLKDGVREIAGSDLPDAEAQKLRVLALAALSLLQILLSDIRRIACALESQR